MANKPVLTIEEIEAAEKAKKLAIKKAKEKKAKEEELKKPKPKQWFLVRIEGVAPVTVEFKVFAEDEETAFDAVERRPNPFVHQAISPIINLRQLQKKRVTIKNLLTGWINWLRNF